MKCHVCRQEIQTRRTTPHVVLLGGEQVTLDVMTYICTCGEEVTTSKDLREAEWVAAKNIIAAGLQTGPRFRFLRKTLGLSVDDIAKWISAEHETIVRWESGEEDLPPHAWQKIVSLVKFCGFRHFAAKPLSARTDITE